MGPLALGLALLLVFVPACTLEFPPELVPCSQLASRTTDVQPVAPPVPALGERFVDPTFHTCITRISDAALDATIPDEARPADVSLDVDGLVAPDGSVALYSTQGYRLYAYDIGSPGRGSATRTYTGYGLGFDLSSPLALVTVDEPELVFEHYVLETSAFTPLSSFGAGLPFDPDGLRASDRTLSADGTRAMISLSFGSERDVAVLDVRTGALVGMHAEGAGASLLSPSGRWVVQTSGGSWRLFPADFSNDGVEVPAERNIVDADTLALPGQRDGLAIVEGTQLIVLDLDASPPTEVGRVALVDPSFLGALELDVHLEGGAFDRPGWLVVTMSDCASGSDMCSDPTSWARPKISLVGIGSQVVIHDLAWHFGSRRSVHAIPSRDLSRVVFTSDWGGGPSEAYAIEIPTGLLRLPG
jgi:hypothetical protein